MSEETEKALRDWRNEERDTGNDLHHHFDDFGRRHWIDISKEALRVFNLMFCGDDSSRDPVEDDSPLDGIWTAAAAAASHGAFAAVASALGVSVDALEHAVGEWYEFDAPGDLDDPIGAEKLMERCRNYESRWP